LMPMGGGITAPYLPCGDSNAASLPDPKPHE
jgi:hypothetical protein